MKKLFWGIKKKTIAFYLAVLFTAFLFTYLTTSALVRRVIEDNLQEKYQFINEKSAIRLADYYQKSDTLMEKFIASQTFQDSLRREPLSKRQVVELRRELSYMTMDHLERSIYIDNKGAIYGELPFGFKKEEIKSWLNNFNFSSSYSTTKWLWCSGFGGTGDDDGLYVGRLLRHFDYPVEPGIVILHLNDQLFNEVLTDPDGDGVRRGIVTPAGEICYQLNDEVEISDYERTVCQTMLSRGEASVRENDELFLMREEKESGFYVLTVVPKSVLNQGVAAIRVQLSLVFLFACIGAYFFSVYYSRKITRPIQEINAAMNQYRATSAKNRLYLNSGTELDTIAQNYNEMVDQISDMVEKIRDDERKMYMLELDSLMYQINPHFLYNILDNIYMLARLDKNERTMKTIQALSEYLRIVLSNEREIITVREELEHVRCYVEMQQVRNGSLFEYEAECAADVADCMMLKILLQPVVENAIKHGFALMQTGGLIKVRATKDENCIRFRVWNNGVPIDENTLQLLNRIQTEPVENMRSIFQNRSGGYGINSVVKRLKLKYGGDFLFYYLDEEGGVSCNIVIPIEKDIK